jgi:hypothetical protein
MGDLPTIKWVDYEDFGLSPLSITTDLEAHLIDGLINCDLQPVIYISYQLDVFLDLVFSISTIETSVVPVEAGSSSQSSV